MFARLQQSLAELDRRIHPANVLLRFAQSGILRDDAFPDVSVLKGFQAAFERRRIRNTQFLKLFKSELLRGTFVHVIVRILSELIPVDAILDSRRRLCNLPSIIWQHQRCIDRRPPLVLSTWHQESKMNLVSRMMKTMYSVLVIKGNSKP